MTEGNFDFSPPGTARRKLLLATGVWAAALTGCERQTTAGLEKYPANPVLAGDLGTCFDVCVLKTSSGYRMWFSWRPKKSIARTGSRDEATPPLHWRQPLQYPPLRTRAWSRAPA